MGIKEILISWNLSKLVKVFEEHEISDEQFGELTPDIIKELIPKIGPRMLFNKKYETYKALPNFSNNGDDHIKIRDEGALTSRSDGFITDWSVSASSATNTFDEYFEIDKNDKEDIIIGGDSNDGIEGINEIIVSKNLSCNINLEGVLESSQKGRMILSYYKTNSKLNNQYKDKLAEIIILNEMTDNFDNRISIKRFQLLSTAIEELFPSEKKEIYFSYTLKKVNAAKCYKIGSGKLFRKFYNHRRELKKHGMLPKLLAVSPRREHITFENDDEILWLKNNLKPWTEVESRWKGTFERRSYYRTDNISTMEYMDTFPALKRNLGYTLMELDFGKLYPQKELKLFGEFASFATRVINHAQGLPCKKLKIYMRVFDNPLLSEDAYNNHVLFLLPQLLKPSTIKKKGTGYWKPSRVEVSEAFIIHVKVPGEINAALERKKKKLKEFGLSLQPTPVIVGTDLENISAAYVAIDNSIYEVPTTLKAVDVCFKAIHALGARYNLEADAVWHFIQKRIYEIVTEYDKFYMSVQNLINEIS